METYQIIVENIKCGGCMNSIKTALLKLNGVSEVAIDKEQDQVSVTGPALNRDELLEKLAALGYPERGNNSLLSKAKSMVSCAVGRMTEKAS
ncbi:MAG: heavy-metal-associated domain-containing protein [Sphingobacteriaceae bacterium]